MFTDLGEQALKNIAQPVRVYRVDILTASNAPRMLEDASALSDLPSVAVLPFLNVSDDPGQDYFADGLTEDIITILSRVRQFFVPARNTTFMYKGRALNVRVVAKELGVKYVQGRCERLAISSGFRCN
jgi:adenylate cyclase